MTTEHVSVPRELFDMAREQIERQRLAALEYGLIAVAEAHSYALHKIDAILSRATPSDTRCTARVKEVPKDKRPSGPANPPKWCCLPAGHDGPHKCNFGGMTAPVPFRDSDEIEWVPLKSTATSAPRVVTDDDVMRACRAYNNPPGPMKPSGYATPHMMRAALESFATSLPAARVPDGNDVCGELVSFIQVGEVARDGDIGRVTMYLPYSFIGRTVYLYDHAYRYQTDNSCTHGETYWKNRAHAAEDKIASQPLMDVCRQCDECAPYLKKDETPAQRIERERKDVTACLRLLQIERKLTDIDRLVDRFLAWPLPPSVCPDGCVMDSSYPHRIGTHLLTAEEAKAMFIHALGRDELLEADHKTGEKA
jgi:hypothetical protein